MKLRWTNNARDDLSRIFDYIAHDNPSTAVDWIEKLIVRARKIPQHPEAGRVVPELADTTIREVLVGHYRIVYRLVPAEVHVLTIFESHRQLDLNRSK